MLNAGPSDACSGLWTLPEQPSVSPVRRDAGPSDDPSPDRPTFTAGPSDALYRTVRHVLSRGVCLPERLFLWGFNGSFCVVVPSHVLSLVAIS